MPGQTLPKPFRRLELTLENLDIPAYRATLETARDGRSLKQTMKEDMERRKTLWAHSFSGRKKTASRPS